MKKVFSLSMLFALAACQHVTTGKNDYDRSKVDLTPVDGGTWVEASIADASFLNPLLASDSASSDINNLVYNGLVKFDKNIQLVGDLAEKWDITNGGRVITFHLRHGILWHDGQPFTSADVLFTYQKLIDPKTRTPFSSDYTLVKKAEAPDPYTFRVTYDKPFAPAMESWGMEILPKHLWETVDINESPLNRAPVGTGPYMFSEWVPDQKIVLVPNPHYYLGKPHFDRYVYRIVPDQAVQFLELRQGTLSSMTPTPDQYNGYDKFFLLYNKYKYPAFRYDYVAFNLKNPLFADRRVRQALSEAVNRQGIIDGVYEGLAVPATGPFAPTSWAYNHDVMPTPFDPDGARRLLAEAGWKDSDGDGILDKDGKPFTFTLLTNQANPVRESIAQVLQNNFSQIGVKMDIRILEWSVFIHKYVDAGNFDAVLLGWNLSRDPDIYQIWHSSQRGPGKYNFAQYANPEVDRLLEEARSTFDIKERTRMYHRIHALIATDVPYIFIVTGESLPVIHKKYIGPELAPAGITWNFETWFVPRAWQRSHLSS